MVLQGERERLGAVPSLADDVEVALDLEQRAQRAEHHGLIFGDEDPDHDATIARVASALRGTTSVRRVPCCPSRSMLPPISASRARIPESPAPSAGFSTQAVVLDRQAHAAAVLGERDAALARPRVTDDVGDGLAQAEREGAFLIGVERDLGHVHRQGDAGRIERGARGRHLLVQPLTAIAIDRLPHFGERVARDALDVADLADGAVEIAIGDLGGELRLQDDDRQRVAEQVVEVARDPLALGDGRQVLGRFVRLDERAILAPHLAEVDVRPADENRDDGRWNPERRRERDIR